MRTQDTWPLNVHAKMVTVVVCGRGWEWGKDGEGDKVV